MQVYNGWVPAPGLEVRNPERRPSIGLPDSWPGNIGRGEGSSPAHLVGPAFSGLECNRSGPRVPPCNRGSVPVQKLCDIERRVSLDQCSWDPWFLSEVLISFSSC